MSDFVHLELTTPDVAAAKTFYTKLFGWKTSDMPYAGGTYTGFKTGGKGPGGGMTAPMMPGAPTAWLPYIGVKSVKKAIAKARDLGAAIHVDYMEVPGQGALGIMADPTGATIAVWEQFEQAPPPKKAAKKTAKKAAKKAPKKTAKKAAKKKR